jgi:Excreted virulence factor EspC, type VII ESX diderm
MADSGFQVTPDELTSFASYLESTTAGEIGTAASGVTSANGLDVSAFGVFLGQTLGVPSRIAMGVASSELKNLADKIKQTADDTRTTAQNYTQNDQDSAGSFDSMQRS